MEIKKTEHGTLPADKVPGADLDPKRRYDETQESEADPIPTDPSETLHDTVALSEEALEALRKEKE